MEKGQDKEDRDTRSDVLKEEILGMSRFRKGLQGVATKGVWRASKSSEKLTGGRDAPH